jgi:hypothetical protein
MVAFATALPVASDNDPVMVAADNPAAVNNPESMDRFIDVSPSLLCVVELKLIAEAAAAMAARAIAAVTERLLDV